MKKVILLGATALLFAGIASANAAQSCDVVAGYCSAKGGTGCYDEKRMADCRRTGSYVAPTGTVWPAIKEVAKPASLKKKVQ